MGGCTSGHGQRARRNRTSTAGLNKMLPTRDKKHATNAYMIAAAFCSTDLVHNDNQRLLRGEYSHACADLLFGHTETSTHGGYPTGATAG